MSITFKKKVSSTNAVRLPAGTRLNANGTLLLTSTGISSLDAFLGGGLPIGSLVLVYEDPNSTLADSILRCYLAEGIYSQQDLCIAAERTNLTENWPIREENETRPDETDNDKMKIAWRYENLSTVDASSASTHPHYNLQPTKPLPSELIEQIQIHNLTWKDYLQSPSTPSYRHYLLQCIQRLITTRYSSQQADKRILRISIQSLSLSLFDTDKTHRSDELFAFFYHLRILLRTSLATCLITLNEKSRALESLADMAFELKLSNLMHNDYVGFCQLIKLPRLNTVQVFIPDTWDIGIKLIKHRKNILFEKYSIPPDLSEDASRDEKPKTFACSPSKQLDF